MAKAWGNLKKIPGHKGYYVDVVSGIIYWRGTIKGQPVKLSTHEKQINKAKFFVDEYRLSLNSDNLSKSKREKKGITDPRVEDIWNEVVKERTPTRSATTVKRYGTVWRSGLEPFWSDKVLSQVTQKTIVTFENWFIENRKNKVFFQTGKYLRMLLGYMHREGYIKKALEVRDLDKTIDGKSKREKPFRIYTPAEQEALIANAVTERARVLIIGYFDTGARKNELLSARKDKVSIEKGTITLWSAKNKKWRVVPLTERFKAALIAYLETADNDSEYLFPMPTDHTRPIYSQLFDDEWNATKKKAGIKGRARNHDTRHTTATTTAKDNWPIPVACAMLDMSADVYIRTYCHISTADIEKHLRRSFG